MCSSLVLKLAQKHKIGCLHLKMNNFTAPPLQSIFCGWSLGVSLWRNDLTGDYFLNTDFLLTFQSVKGNSSIPKVQLNLCNFTLNLQANFFFFFFSYTCSNEHFVISLSFHFFFPFDFLSLLWLYYCLEKKTFKTEGFACHCLFNLNIFIGDHMHFLLILFVFILMKR